MGNNNWRNNITVELPELRGKIAFKTTDTSWLETKAPVIVLVSINSQFHEGQNGVLKLPAMLSTIKNHVRGKITILLSDLAHLQTQILKHAGNRLEAIRECRRQAEALHEQHAASFASCQIAYWHSYISQDERFTAAVEQVRELARQDLQFQKLLESDAEANYTLMRAQEYPERHQFVEKSIEELIEQCASLIVLSNKGYRFQFYPGRPHAATEYANSKLLAAEEQLAWINVFLAIEKKTFKPTLA